MEARENTVALAGVDEGRLSVTNAAAGQTRQALQDIAFGSVCLVSSSRDFLFSQLTPQRQPA